jgi:hypothetical protein
MKGYFQKIESIEKNLSSPETIGLYKNLYLNFALFCREIYIPLSEIVENYSLDQ